VELVGQVASHVKRAKQNCAGASRIGPSQPRPSPLPLLRAPRSLRPRLFGAASSVRRQQCLCARPLGFVRIVWEGSVLDVPIFEIAGARSWISRRCFQSCCHVSIWHFTAVKERTAFDSGVGRSGGCTCEASETKLLRCVGPFLPVAGSIESPALAQALTLWSGPLSSTAAAPIRQAARLHVLYVVQG